MRNILLSVRVACHKNKASLMLVVFSQGVLRLCSVELSRTTHVFVRMTSRYYFNSFLSNLLKSLEVTNRYNFTATEYICKNTRLNDLFGRT